MMKTDYDVMIFMIIIQNLAPDTLSRHVYVQLYDRFSINLLFYINIIFASYKSSFRSTPLADEHWALHSKC